MSEEADSRKQGLRSRWRPDNVGLVKQQGVGIFFRGQWEAICSQKETTLIFKMLLWLKSMESGFQ